MLRWMQVGPLHVMECELRLKHLEFIRMDINVERAVEQSAQVQPAFLKERPLPVEGAIRIIFRRAGRNPVSLYEHAADGPPRGLHRSIVPFPPHVRVRLFALYLTNTLTFGIFMSDLKTRTKPRIAKTLPRQDNLSFDSMYFFNALIRQLAELLLDDHP
jgi:hypothetical protein